VGRRAPTGATTAGPAARGRWARGRRAARQASGPGLAGARTTPATDTRGACRAVGAANTGSAGCARTGRILTVFRRTTARERQARDQRSEQHEFGRLVHGKSPSSRATVFCWRVAGTLRSRRTITRVVFRRVRLIRREQPLGVSAIAAVSLGFRHSVTVPFSPIWTLPALAVLVALVRVSRPCRSYIARQVGPTAEYASGTAEHGT
jgi:hypothetical protein